MFQKNNALSNAEINRASKLLIFFSTVNGEEFSEAGIFGMISSLCYSANTYKDDSK